MKKIITSLAIGGLLFPFLISAQQGPVSPPENMEEAEALGEKAVQVTEKELPGTLEKIWNNEVLPIWQKMYNWFLENIWSKIDTWFKNTLQPLLKGEFEKRKPVVQEEFQKEKQELKEEAPEVGKSLWERFKDLIK